MQVLEGSKIKSYVGLLIVLLVFCLSTPANAFWYDLMEGEFTLAVLAPEVILDTTRSKRRTYEIRYVDVLLHDHNGQPVEGATVYGQWLYYDRLHSTRIAITGVDGVATFRGEPRVGFGLPMGMFIVGADHPTLAWVGLDERCEFVWATEPEW